MDTKGIDHKAEALERLEHLENSWDSVDAHVALVHSNLAIAEGQERVAEETKLLREALEGVIWTNQIPRGGVDRKLRVTHE